MSATYWAALAAMILAGLAVASQAPINARLGGGLGGNLLAATASFGVGFALLLVIVFLRGTMPASEVFRTTPWWAWTGGLLGAYYVWIAIFSVPILGVVTMLSALILGQMVGALVLDAVGAFGLPMRQISWSRIAAVLLVAAGVFVSTR